MAREERSAGFVIFRRSPGDRGRLFLLLDYGRHWDYAKGHVEKGEDDLSAAHRELAEETGLTGARVIEGFRHEIAYFFNNKHKGRIRKTVVFFLGEIGGGEPGHVPHAAPEVTLSHEHTGFAWLPFEEAMARLTYPTAKAVLEAAGAWLDTH